MDNTITKIWKIDESNGKEAKTFFKLIHYNKKENTSIIFAKPITGRYHL
jgi:23S rRNA-/tRNA-specific pseudouridylate synthase